MPSYFKHCIKNLIENQDTNVPRYSLLIDYQVKKILTLRRPFPWEYGDFHPS
jgi:hypothetical protein